MLKVINWKKRLEAIYILCNSVRIVISKLLTGTLSSDHLTPGFVLTAHLGESLNHISISLLLGNIAEVTAGVLALNDWVLESFDTCDTAYSCQIIMSVTKGISLFVLYSERVFFILHVVLPDLS